MDTPADSTQRLLDKLSYVGLTEGDYADSSLPPSWRSLSTPSLRRISQPQSHRLIGEMRRSDRCFGGREGEEPEVEETKSPPQGEVPCFGGVPGSSAGFADLALYEEALKEGSPQKYRGIAVQALSLSASSRLPAEVAVLEQMLSLEYNSPVKITRIKELPPTRKQVKEVYFLINETNLSKVWVFRADPKTTRNELNAYHVIHQQGVLTGKPLGYSPSVPLLPYPYDVAVLGGVVEHAGDPYEQMLENLSLNPHTIFYTARAIARTMAEYQVKLTRAKEEFERYEITLPEADPGKEIQERFVSGLDREMFDGSTTQRNINRLITACRKLYSAQNSSKLISHGDCHLGNIVTVMEEKYGGTLSTNRFGIIDWGSLQWDTPFGDIQDFWLHHRRKAQEVCPDYQYDVSALESVFFSSLREAAKVNGSALKLNYDFNDSLIQSALWNLYEIYDPTRRDSTDAQTTKVHTRGLWDNLDKLVSRRPDLRETAETIKEEVTTIKRWRGNFLYPRKE